jgi:hypothetical protein
MEDDLDERQPSSKMNSIADEIKYLVEMEKGLHPQCIFYRN